MFHHTCASRVPLSPPKSRSIGGSPIGEEPRRRLGRGVRHRRRAGLWSLALRSRHCPSPRHDRCRHRSQLDLRRCGRTDLRRHAPRGARLRSLVVRRAARRLHPRRRGLARLIVWRQRQVVAHRLRARPHAWATTVDDYEQERRDVGLVRGDVLAKGLGRKWYARLVDEVEQTAADQKQAGAQPSGAVAVLFQWRRFRLSHVGTSRRRSVASDDASWRKAHTRHTTLAEAVGRWRLPAAKVPASRTFRPTPADILRHGPKARNEGVPSSNLGVGSPLQASPSRSSRIRTFVARSPTDFSHDESEGGTLSGLGVAKASGG